MSATHPPFDAGPPGALRRRRLPLAHLALLAAAGLMGAGCLTGRGGDTGSFRDAEAVTLDVNNRHWRDVVVYVTRGGARSRLGMVTSNSQAEFTLARDFLAGGYTVTLLAEVVGSSESLRPGPVTVSPGDVILWRLRPVLNQSDVSVRPGGGEGEGGGGGGPNGGTGPQAAAGSAG